MNKNMRRFPIEPLLNRLSEEPHPWEQVGVSRRAWHRSFERGWVSEFQADKWTINMDLHPYLVWPDLWFEGTVLDDPDDEEVYTFIKTAAA